MRWNLRTSIKHLIYWIKDSVFDVWFGWKNECIHMYYCSNNS
jgi:hypothetical protein